jgi:hypothetical protein
MCVQFVFNLQTADAFADAFGDAAGAALAN